MTSVLAKYIAKKVLGESVKNHFGQEDPYFETVPANDLGTRPSKKAVKRPKSFPAGISEHDKKVLTKARRRAYILDYGFNLCGIKFGMSSLIGIIPVIGDVLDLFMAIMVFRTCKAVDGDLPSILQLQMVSNIAVDFLVGLIPFLGDIADAMFRCNTRNLVLLEKHLTTEAQRSGAAANPIDNPPDYERVSSRPARGPTGPEPTLPDRARTRPESGRTRPWYEFRGGRQAERDVERVGAP